jgi:hypothetical protein
MVAVIASHHIETHVTRWRSQFQGRECQRPWADLLPAWYICTMIQKSKEGQKNAMSQKKKAGASASSRKRILVERIQTGVRLEKRLLKVLKGLAEYHDMTLGDLLEGIVLHAFDGRHPFSDQTRRRIDDLKRIYGLDLDSSASHRLMEIVEESGSGKTAKRGSRKAKK